MSFSGIKKLVEIAEFKASVTETAPWWENPPPVLGAPKPGVAPVRRPRVERVEPPPVPEAEPGKVRRGHRVLKVQSAAAIEGEAKKFAAKQRQRKAWCALVDRVGAKEAKRLDDERKALKRERYALEKARHQARGYAAQYLVGFHQEWKRLRLLCDACGAPIWLLWSWRSYRFCACTTYDATGCQQITDAKPTKNMSRDDYCRRKDAVLCRRDWHFVGDDPVIERIVADYLGKAAEEPITWAYQLFEGGEVYGVDDERGEEADRLSRAASVRQRVDLDDGIELPVWAKDDSLDDGDGTDAEGAA